MKLKEQRRWIQAAFLVGLHSAWGVEAKWFCNPVLSCHSCALSWFACPVGVFIHYAGWWLFPFIAAGTVLLIGAVFGRLLCGWVCPFGFLQDLLAALPVPKVRLPAGLRYCKYAVLLFMVFLFPFLLGEKTTLSFCRYCPASALQVTIPNVVGGTQAGALTVVKLGILAAVLVLACLSTRSFCRILCPIGALLVPLNYVSWWYVKPPVEACTKCTVCDRECIAEGTPSSRIEAGVPPSRTGECVLCYNCQIHCPERKRQRRENAAGTS